MTTSFIEQTDNLGVLWQFKDKFGFSEVPPQESYEVYFKSLLVCANGDGTLANEERDWVIGFASAYNCDPGIIEQLKVYKADEDIEEVFSRHPRISESRRFLIFDAIQACCADGDYSEKERAIVLKGAKALNVSDDEFKKIEEIYFETAKLREKRLAVMYPNGFPW